MARFGISRSAFGKTGFGEAFIGWSRAGRSRARGTRTRPGESAAHRMAFAKSACGVACCAIALLAPSVGAAVEWNPVRARSVTIGPEADRLIVGFRATSGNAAVTTITSRTRAMSVNTIQATTSAVDVTDLARRTGMSMARSRQITPSMHVLYLPKTLYGADVEATLAKLRSDATVQFAVVDQRRYPHALPNDPLFPAVAPSQTGQWYMQPPSTTPVTVGGNVTTDLSATDAVSAWTITTGSSGTVIADVDTGVRFDHPDLLRAGFGGRMLPGYDFVDQDFDSTGKALGTFLYANDGDGWDPDPSDPGDWISSTDLKNPLFPPASCGDPNNNNGPTDSSWHGTRVAGVLGALSNNGVGIAGMTWNPYFLPVRALGKCGGYDSDIIIGIEWAVGMTVTGVPDNPYPADIVNLSLGGTGACVGIYAQELPRVIALGVLVVASAGNGDKPGNPAPVDSPANCPGVLAVAGLRNVGTKVGYSSFGPEVGVSAPAGNCLNSGLPCLRAIDTTTNSGLTVPALNGYSDQQNPSLGTSFSAPIVAGIAALMRSVNANLTPDQLIARIKSSSTAFPANTGGLPVCPQNAMTTGECSCTTTTCGAGMVNALAAVHAAQKPIAAVNGPTSVTNVPVTYDASGSVAACNVGVTPNVPLSIASYAWTASGGVTISGASNTSQVTVTPGSTAGTLTLTVTDSVGASDTATVNFTGTGAASTSAPASAGSSAGACPTALSVAPAAPTVSEAFAPTSVAVNGAATLTITLGNTNGFDLTQAGFSETLPGNLTIQATPAPSSTCSGHALSVTGSASTVTLANANIPAKSSCTVTLSVKSASAGSYTSTLAANALSTGPAGPNTADGSAILTVTAPSGGGGGGALDTFDLMFVAGVLLAGRRHMRRRS